MHLAATCTAESQKAAANLIILLTAENTENNNRVEVYSYMYAALSSGQALPV
jgi:hypothetical protein